MDSRQRMALVGAIALGVAAVAVSVLLGGGWAVVLLEVGAAGLLFLLFLLSRNED